MVVLLAAVGSVQRRLYQPASPGTTKKFTVCQMTNGKLERSRLTACAHKAAIGERVAWIDPHMERRDANVIALDLVLAGNATNHRHSRRGDQCAGIDASIAVR